MIQVSRYAKIDIDVLKDKSIEARYDIMLSFVKDIERQKKQAEAEKRR